MDDGMGGAEVADSVPISFPDFVVPCLGLGCIISIVVSICICTHSFRRMCQARSRRLFGYFSASNMDVDQSLCSDTPQNPT